MLLVDEGWTATVVLEGSSAEEVPWSGWKSQGLAAAIAALIVAGSAGTLVAVDTIAVGEARIAGGVA